MKLSACWIAKDEAKNIAKSILSVKDCVDELVVVDTGSRDETAKVALECGARVENFQWNGDFSAARNYALSLVQHDYTIFIDADEYFSPPLRKADRGVILGILQSTGVDALLVPLADADSAGRLSESAPFGRVFRRELRYEGTIHEMIKRLDGSLSSAVILEHYLLVHTGYAGERALEKSRRNAALLEAQWPLLADDFSRFNNKAYLVREYMVLGDFDSAFEHCRYLLDNHTQWERLSKTFLFNDVRRLYAAIALAAAQPYRFDPREAYEKLFLPLKYNYPESREAALSELHYQLIFNFNPDMFFTDLTVAEAKTASIAPAATPESRDAEAAIYAAGALAARDAATARRWAERALELAPERDMEALRWLLQRTPSP